jgi:hypothetical protein
VRSIPIFLHLSDADLLHETVRLAGCERDATVDLIVSLQEVDRRQLFLPAGYGSLFKFCVIRLGLAEGAAYTRIEAARAAQRFPVILEMLADGSSTLATIGVIGRHLTTANYQALLEESRSKAKREVERIVARLQPRADVPTMIRKLPALAAVVVESGTASPPAPPPGDAEPLALTAPTAVVCSTSQQARAVIAPLTPERFKFQITIDRETHDTLREIQDLIRHTVPTGDAAAIVARALRLLRDQLLRQKAAQVRNPRAVKPAIASDGSAANGDADDIPPPSRQIPAAVKRAVWERDGGQCAFTGADGRCLERTLLEFHHVRPFAAAGESTAGNLELRCRAHNAFEAQLFFRPDQERRRA